jgi:hypothetical protein
MLVLRGIEFDLTELDSATPYALARLNGLQVTERILNLGETFPSPSGSESLNCALRQVGGDLMMTRESTAAHNFLKDQLAAQLLLTAEDHPKNTFNASHLAIWNKSLRRQRNKGNKGDAFI